MSLLLLILTATISISALALVGSLGLSLFPKLLKKLTLFLVALAAGTMLSTGLFELLPEASHELGLQTSLWILALTFAVLLGAEKILHWHHCHDEDCERKPIGYLNLWGDAIHNFLDGIVIAAAFQVSTPVGIATTVAVALHELPQEIGDFGVLIHSGFSRAQAVVANLAVAFTAVIGGMVGFWLTQYAEPVAPYLLPIAAGTFLYLAAVDLIPEFREEDVAWKSAVLFLCFGFGLFGLPLISDSLGLGHSHEHDTVVEAAPHHGDDHQEFESDHD